MFWLLFVLPLLPTVITGESEDYIVTRNHCTPLLNNSRCNLECLHFSKLQKGSDLEGRDCSKHPVKVELRNVTICFNTILDRSQKFFAQTLVSIALQSMSRALNYNPNVPTCIKFLLEQDASITLETFNMETEQLKQDILDKMHETASIHRDFPTETPEKRIPTWVYIIGVCILVGILATIGSIERSRKRRIVENRGTWIPDVEHGLEGGTAKRGRFIPSTITSGSDYESTIVSSALSQDSQMTPTGPQYNYSIPHPIRGYRNPAPNYNYRNQDYNHLPGIQGNYPSGTYAPVRGPPAPPPPALPLTPGQNCPRFLLGPSGSRYPDQMSSAHTYSTVVRGTVAGPAPNRLFVEATRGGIRIPVSWELKSKVNKDEVKSSVNGLFPIHAVVKRTQQMDLMISDIEKILEAGGVIDKKTCINRNYDPNSSVKDEQTALMLAVERELHLVACFLLAEGACQWRINSDNSTCLHEAVNNEDVQMVQLLLKYHKDDPKKDELIDDMPKIDGVNKLNMTPLMLCARALPERAARMAKLLIEVGGANVNSIGDEEKFASALQDYPELTGSTVLHYSVSYNNIALLQYLLSLKELKINAQDVHERTAVFIAVRNGNLEALKLLLQQNASTIMPALRYRTQKPMEAMQHLSEADIKYETVHEAAAGDSDILAILKEHESRKKKRRSGETPRTPALPHPPRASTVDITLPTTEGHNTNYHTPTTSNNKKRRLTRAPFSTVNVNISREPLDVNQPYADYTPNYIQNPYESNYQTPNNYPNYGQYYTQNGYYHQ